jgi:hypothetical protein
MNQHKQLVHEIDTLIKLEGVYDQNGYSLSYDRLDENEQHKIVACFIDYDDRDLFSIYENEKFDEIASALLTMLKNGTRDSDEDFAQCLKKNLTAYYAKRAQKLINERCVEIESNENWDHGLVKRQNRNTGEFQWSNL